MSHPPEGAKAPGRERLLVSVGPSPLSLRLVRAPQRIAAAQEVTWFALYMETPGHERLTSEKREIVSQALLPASQLGAQVVRVSDFRIGNEILTLARENQVAKTAPAATWYDISPNSPSRGAGNPGCSPYL